MATEAVKVPSLGQLAMVYRISDATLKAFRQRGCDVTDAREVFRMLEKTTRKPDEWKDFFTETDDSHENWKKEKTKEEVEGLRLKNAKASGEMFDKVDGERIQEAWASALKLALAERRATVPQLLAGKDEAWISDYMQEDDRKMEGNLSDLESGLWRQVYEQYSVVTEPSADATKVSGIEAPAKEKRQRVVRD